MATATNSHGMRLLKHITCPHCWERFPPESVLWVAEHHELYGDARLGGDQPQRFLPTRFTIAGEAVDGRGFACRQLACPKCHLSVPRALLEREPLFLSIVGSPASGKSYFLAAMTWELRRILNLQFAMSFADADPVLNQTLNQYEESLFVSDHPDELVPLTNLIRKTEEQGDLYDLVSFGTQTVSYPRPFVFSLQPSESHSNAKHADKLGRVLCLYDNAGESFQPGKDTTSNPVTRHLAQSSVLFFVFDPTQDSRLRARIGTSAARNGPMRMTRQESLLQEAASRVRRHAGLREGQKHDRPLVVIVTKADEWSELLGEDPPPEPYRPMPGSASTGNGRAPMHAIDRRIVERRSDVTRSLLVHFCPEMVAAAEGFAREVVYVPVSAIGWNSVIDEASGLPAIQPAKTKPHWVSVPLIYALSRWSRGIVPGIAAARSGRESTP